MSTLHFELSPVIDELSKLYFFFPDEFIRVIGHFVQFDCIISKALVNSGLVELRGHD